MKRYLIWLASAYLLLLLVPLPLFIAHSLEGSSRPGGESAGSKTSGQFEPSRPPSPLDDETFKLYSTADKTVYEVSARELMIGSTAAEMYPTYHAEALKAQAAAVYTLYSVKRAASRANPDPSLEGADFADTAGGFPIYRTKEDLQERYGENFDAYYTKICDAVDAVLGKRILYNGEPILAMYHAISAGTTEDAAVLWGGSGYPYLQPVASPGDKLSPNYKSEVTFTPDELFNKLVAAESSLVLDGDPSGWMDPDVQISASSTVVEMKIGGTVFTGRQLRETLELRSYCFVAEYKDGLFHFEVYGYGHDVGMSQYGADSLARQGLKWDEILQYYYTDVTVE